MSIEQDDSRRKIALRAAALRHANNDTEDKYAIADLGRIAGENTNMLTSVAADLMTGWVTDPPQRQARRVRSVWLLLAAGGNIAEVAERTIAASQKVRA